MYAGQLLPASRYETWAEAARAHLSERYLELLRAGEQWERLVEMDPTDERAHRHLMRRALGERNRPAAIRWYGRLRNALAVIGMLPDAETEALYEDCVASLQPAGPGFVGRAFELAKITAVLRAEAQERPGSW